MGRTEGRHRNMQRRTVRAASFHIWHGVYSANARCQVGSRIPKRVAVAQSLGLRFHRPCHRPPEHQLTSVPGRSILSKLEARRKLPVMSMKPNGKWTLACTVLALAIPMVTISSDGEKRPQKSVEKVKVDQFGPDNVIGYLGHPLGTVVRVTGMCRDGETTRLRKWAGATLLEIKTCNGTVLDAPVLIEYPLRTDGIAKPKPGDRFDYYVHESGAFDGVVWKRRQHSA